MKPNKALAKRLGAAFKKGYPETYLKTQTGPIYRKTWAGQDKEVRRLSATRGIPRKFAINLLRNKYKKSKIKFIVIE